MQILSAAHSFVSLLTLLVCIAILIVALGTLRRADKSVRLAERRMEYLHEEQLRLKAGHAERHALMEELGTVQEQNLVADRERESTAERLQNIEKSLKKLKGRVVSQEPETKSQTNGNRG